MCRIEKEGRKAGKALHIVVSPHRGPNGLRIPTLPVRPYRRKHGVNTGDFGCSPYSFLKNTLDTEYQFKPHSHRASNCLPPKNVPTFPTYPHAGSKQVKRGVPVSAHMEKEATLNSLEMDREVIRCKTCGLVQYRTRTGNCRRCVRALPQRMEYLIPQEVPQEQEAAEVLTPKFPNQETVENIGQRIRQLRESRTMTQSQLQARSKVSRSYLSRIESGQMTPSLGTLEKISEALNVGLNRFFIPESDGEALLEDPFIQGLRPFLRQLDWEQWQSILKRLQAISDNVSATPATLRPIGNPARLPQSASGNGLASGNGNGPLGHVGHNGNSVHANGHAMQHAHGHPQGYPLRRPGPVV